MMSSYLLVDGRPSIRAQMQLLDFNNTVLAIVGIVLLGLIGAGVLAFVRQPGAATGTVLATANTAVGSLAGGRKQKRGARTPTKFKRQNRKHTK